MLVVLDVMFIFLEDGKFEHLILEIILFIVIIVTDFGEGRMPISLVFVQLKRRFCS